MTTPPADALSIRREDAGSQVAAALIAELDADLHRRYPGQPVHGIAAADFERLGGLFFVGFEGDVALACGAIRPAGPPGVAEIKRMFVRPQARGRGHARQMLATLEREARARGYARAVLETGVLQPEAIALYASAGYEPIPAYGEYESDPRSRCFAKALA